MRNFLRIFIFEPPDFFADFLARFFCPHFCGEKVPRKILPKVLGEIIQDFYKKIPDTFLAEGPGSQENLCYFFCVFATECGKMVGMENSGIDKGTRIGSALSQLSDADHLCTTQVCIFQTHQLGIVF